MLTGYIMFSKNLTDSDSTKLDLSYHKETTPCSVYPQHSPVIAFFYYYYCTIHRCHRISFVVNMSSTVDVFDNTAADTEEVVDSSANNYRCAGYQFCQTRTVQQCRTKKPTRGSFDELGNCHGWSQNLVMRRTIGLLQRRASCKTDLPS